MTHLVTVLSMNNTRKVESKQNQPRKSMEKKRNISRTVITKAKRTKQHETKSTKITITN